MMKSLWWEKQKPSQINPHMNYCLNTLSPSPSLTPTHKLLMLQLLTHSSSNESKSKKRSLGRNLILLLARELRVTTGEKSTALTWWRCYITFVGVGVGVGVLQCSRVDCTASPYRQHDRLTDESSLADRAERSWWWSRSCFLQWICWMDGGVSCLWTETWHITLRHHNVSTCQNENTALSSFD